MGNTYFWDFKFDFTAGKIDVGLVQAQSGGKSINITGECQTSSDGLAFSFDQGDIISFNIFDGTGGCTLQSATITFPNGTSPFSPYVGGNNIMSLNNPVLTPDGKSTAFGGTYPHWMFPEYVIGVSLGTFPFTISLVVTNNGTQKTITKDPEMIVGGTN